MKHLKWIAPLIAYLTVAAGLFLAHSAWGTLLAFHLGIIISLLLAKPDVSPALLFKSTDKKWIVLSVLLCGSSGICVYLLRSRFGIAQDLSTQLQAIGLRASTWPLFIAYFSLVNPLIEEYFWRGYLGSPRTGFHIYDAVFAGYHVFLLLGKVPVSSILFALVVLTLAGWFWRQVIRRDHGLLAAVLGHMSADFSILMVLYRMSSL